MDFGCRMGSQKDHRYFVGPPILTYTPPVRGFPGVNTKEQKGQEG